MKTKKSILSLTILMSLFSSANAQVTITLQPHSNTGKDAYVSNTPYEVNTNFGDNVQLAALAWTFQGTRGDYRGLIDFDLSSIPSNSEIINATLTFYAWGEEGGLGLHSSLSGSNRCLLKQITSAWDENTVTWNTQPTTTSTGQIQLNQSTNGDQNYNINVTEMIQNKLDNPSLNYGFLLKLQNESHYRRMNFASSDHPDTNKHPKLVLTYNPKASTDKYDEVHFSVFPNPASDELVISIDDSFNSQRFSIEIIDYSGKIINRIDETKFSEKIDVSNYSKGFYFVKIKSENSTYNRKVIIK